MPANIQLADENFNTPAEVDMLIGGELFYSILSIGLKSIGQGLPDVQNSVFEWVVIGKLLCLETNDAFAGVGVHLESGLDTQLTKFWQVEEKDAPIQPLTEKELECERYYGATTTRDRTGRFIVKLQLTKEPEI